MQVEQAFFPTRGEPGSSKRKGSVKWGLQPQSNDFVWEVKRRIFFDYQDNETTNNDHKGS